MSVPVFSKSVRLPSPTTTQGPCGLISGGKDNRDREVDRERWRGGAMIAEPNRSSCVRPLKGRLRDWPLEVRVAPGGWLQAPIQKYQFLF